MHRFEVQLKKKSDTKSCHNISWEDDYSWVHQADILEVLKDNSKLSKILLFKKMSYATNPYAKAKSKGAMID